MDFDTPDNFGAKKPREITFYKNLNMIFDVAVKGAHARKCFALFSSSSGCLLLFYQFILCLFVIYISGATTSSWLTQAWASKHRVRAHNLLLHPPATPHSSGGSAGPDWGIKAISVTRGQQGALSFSSCPHTEGLWLCQSISGSVQGDSPSSRLCVHHAAGRGSLTVGRVPCGEPESWVSAPGWKATWWTGDKGSTHTDFEGCS